MKMISLNKSVLKRTLLKKVRLKKMLPALLAVGLLVTAVNIAYADDVAKAQSSQGAVARVQAALNNMSSMEAGFYQRVISPEQQIIDEGSGHFYLSRPGKFRWDYFSEEGSESISDEARKQNLKSTAKQSANGKRELVNKIISDSEQIYFYNVDLETVTIRSMQDAINQVPSLVLVSDKVQVKDVFTVTELPPSLGLHWFFLKPKSADANYTELRLGFAQQQLTAFSIVDVLGQTTQLQFDSIKNRAAFDAKVFEFIVPEGVDVNRAL